MASGSKATTGTATAAAAARAAGIEVVVQADPKLVTAAEIAPGTDLIVTDNVIPSGATSVSCPGGLTLSLQLS